MEFRIPEGSVWLCKNWERRRKRRHQTEKMTDTDTSRRPPSMDSASVTGVGPPPLPLCS
jgi:hypothetical protein